MRTFESLQIAVAGTGYVGLSIATHLAQHHDVTAVDIISEKVAKINKKISPTAAEPLHPGTGEVGRGKRSDG